MVSSDFIFEHRDVVTDVYGGNDGFSGCRVSLRWVIVGGMCCYGVKGKMSYTLCREVESMS